MGLDLLYIDLYIYICTLAILSITRYSKSYFLLNVKHCKISEIKQELYTKISTLTTYIFVMIATAPNYLYLELDTF